MLAIVLRQLNQPEEALTALAKELKLCEQGCPGWKAATSLGNGANGCCPAMR